MSVQLGGPNAKVIWRFGTVKVSFCGEAIILCPNLGGSTIGDNIMLLNMVINQLMNAAGSFDYLFIDKLLALYQHSHFNNIHSTWCHTCIVHAHTSIVHAHTCMTCFVKVHGIHV